MSYSSSDKYRKASSPYFRMDYSSPRQDRDEANDRKLNPEKYKEIDRKSLLDYTDISDVINSKEYKDYSSNLQERVENMGYHSYQDLPEDVFNRLHKQGHSLGYPTPEWMTKHDFIYDDIEPFVRSEEHKPMSMTTDLLKAYKSLEPYSERERKMGNPFPWAFGAGQEDSNTRRNEVYSIIDMLDFS
jgi:hypothetical protein